MPGVRPSLRTIIDRAVSDVETRLDATAVRWRRSVEAILARMVAGISHGLHGYLEWLERMLIWDTATGEYLERWASIFGVERIPGVRATGQVGVTGTIGTLIPAGTQWVRDDGWIYETIADVTTSASPQGVAIRSVDVGADGNVAFGVELTIGAPIAGLASTAPIYGSPITDGVDLEGYPALLARFLAHLRQPPSGGGPGDYVRWARSVPGVTRAWEAPATPKLGWVTVWAVRDGEVPITPSASEIDAIEAAISEVAPINMAGKIVVAAPVLLPLTVELSIVPDTTALRDAVGEALEAMVIERASPSATASTFKLAWIYAAIASVRGLSYPVITTPGGDVAVAAGELVTFDAGTDLTFT